MRRPSGFTMLEIIVVLLLMSILAATVIGRSVTTSNLDLTSATDKIRNQIRFAQAQAMKRSDAVWGIKSDSAIKQYWLFRASRSGAEEVVIPGGDYASGSTRISFTALGADLNSFTVVFDRLGRPFNGHINGVPNNPVASGDNPKSRSPKGNNAISR